MLRVTAISQHISWENANENFAIVESVLNQLDSVGDLIVLPECFSTGFSMNRAVCQTIESAQKEGGSLHFLKSIAKKYNAAFLASILVQEGDNFYNRAYFVLPNGSFLCYNKRHLFSIADESKIFTPGTQELIVNYKGFNICINVCYDIRFPVWSRNTSLKYDVLINIANFPKGRIAVVEPLVKARAIENISYVLFCNRDGKDESLSYSPSSLSADYKGNLNYNERFLLDCKGNSTQVITCEYNKESLLEFREKFPVWRDFDNFTVCK